jgi:hypothetical protein
MKKVLATAATLLITVALTFGAYFALKPESKPSITPQRKATHLISYVEVSKEGYTKEKSYCTGTAVGPHAILTAVHCDEGETDIIRLDLTMRLYHIVGIATDGRDHIIYHIDGPALKNYITLKQREAVLGETVTSYGNGGPDYPQHTYFGKVIKEPNGGDTSEIDAADGTHLFSLQVVPGDSGSAVYGTDGDVVAIVTYGNEQATSAAGFALAFTPKVLEEIKQ